MKRVKIMFTAIAVFAVVGGALAFKAKRIPITYFCSNAFNPTTCDVPVIFFLTPSAVGNFVLTTCTIIPASNTPAFCTVRVTPTN